MAQLDWSTLSAKTGSSACPLGVTEKRQTLISIDSIEPGARSVTLSNAALSQASLRTHTGYPAIFFFNVTVSLIGPDGLVGPRGIGSTDGTTVVAQKRVTFANLKPGARYSARLNGVPSGRPAVAFAIACFQMPPDLNTHVSTNLGTNPLGASGCFAIGGVRWGGGNAAIQACLCGARNGAGKWARTNAGDGYNYILKAAERTRLGCTTN